MNRQLLLAIHLGLVSGLSLSSCNLFQARLSPSSNLSVSTLERARPEPQAISVCPRQFAGWTLVKRFETAHYWLALCRRGESLYLVGHEKEQHEAFIAAPAQTEDEEVLAVDDANRLSYEIRQGTLTITKNGTIIVQEGVN